MDEQNKNLILATVLSFLVVMVWFWLFPPEDPTLAQLPPATEVTESGDIAAPTADQATGNTTAAAIDTTSAAVDAPRVTIETPELTGSLSLQGARIDDLSLLAYRETLDEDAEIVRLMKPVGEAGAYFASFGWASAGGLSADQVPGPDTIWSLESGDTLTPDTPVTLAWDNGAGQIFRTTISVDDRFMFDFAQSVENTGAGDITLRPYGLLRRHGLPDDLKNFFILHEGLVRMTDGELEETSYSNIADYDADPREGTQAERLEATETGWIGYTDHFWMTTLIPQQGTAFRSTSKYFDSRDLYQAEAVMPLQTVAAGGSPLAYKSYVSMAKMKELQPEMEALKERAGDDKQAMQQGMMKLYKDNKVNPAAGCMPILLQIPIFFSLYKVIFVTIELRHAPWVGWIKDLSAPDPSSFINLFGLLPWSAPEPGSLIGLLFIGIMPIVLGVSMWLQQKLNPAPTDPTQKMIFAWMPWVFMFMLGGFASGLVLYWITNNVITFGQQYIIMRSHGAKPDVFGNILSGFKKDSASAEAANKSSKPKDK